MSLITTTGPAYHLSANEILCIFEITLFTCGAYLIFRICRISKFRINLIGEDFIAYLSLPSFENMLLHFWIWPLSRFITRRKKSNEEELEALVEAYRSMHTN